MAPGIALSALRAGNKTMRVLDPMAGSGTVLAVARGQGHRAYGVDLDPLAVLIARVWTTTIDPVSLMDKGKQVLARAKEIHKVARQRDAYPRGSDDETRRFIRYWFDDYARQQLSALAVAIGRVRDPVLREALWCAFSRMIISKNSGASLAMDLAHSRPHVMFATAPAKPFASFASAVAFVAANCPQRSADVPVGPPAVVRQGDARDLPIATGTIDLVVTSPPYLNAIDYLRCSKFSLVWMGYRTNELRQLRSEIVGSEVSLPDDEALLWMRHFLRDLRLRPALSSRSQAVLARYVRDMDASLAETARVLAKGGRAVYVVGDSKLRGTFIPNSEIVTRLGGRHGLRLLSTTSRLLPRNSRYLPPPTRRQAQQTLDARIAREVVIELAR